MKIEICDKGDSRVRPFIRDVPATSRGILFAGDRWSVVDVIAIALSGDGEVVGLGTLSPTDEMGRDVPTIVGLWVRPQNRREGVAMAILRALAEETARRWSGIPHVDAVSPSAARLCHRAVRDGIEITFQDFSSGIDLP